MITIKKDTWYILGNDLQTRMKGRGLAGWESKDLPMVFEYLNDGQCVNGNMFCNVESERTEADLHGMVGKKVEKSSTNGKRASKPFKSGNKINTVKGLITHPQRKTLAFTFEEDDSYVECNQCFLAIVKENLTTTAQVLACPETPEGFNEAIDIMVKKDDGNAKLWEAVREGFNVVMGK